LSALAVGRPVDYHRPMMRNLHKRRLRAVLAVIAALAALAATIASLPTAGAPAGADVGSWPQWRGPTGNGVAHGADPPVVWSEDRNVVWKRAIPGRGLSSPVVWKDRIYVTTAVPVGASLAAGPAPVDGAHDNMTARHELAFKVLAFDTASGAPVWETTVRRLRPHESTHTSASWASPSPATDGRRVYASFGSAGIYALDLAGKQLWSVDLGDMKIRHGHGEGSSPVLHGDTLVVNWDHQGQSFVIALAAATGKERWRVARDEITSWSSPLVVEHDGTVQVIVSATGRVRGYDLADGKEIWAAAGLSRNVVASPVAADGLVYVGNSYDERAMMAVDLRRARGDVSGGDAIVWTRSRDTPYVPSPVLSGDRLCFLKHYQALLTCVNGPSGETLFGPRRLPGMANIYASPVAAGGRLYVAGLNGATAVLADTDTFRHLATNRLDDSFAASPAVAGRAIYLRGERHLYKIEARESPAPPTPSSESPQH
jgi:outer membrane protein assembly factor BamB